MVPVYLNQFKIVLPKNCVDQERLLDWIIKCHQLAEASKISGEEKVGAELIDKLFRRYGVKPAQISQRFVESDDVLTDEFENNQVYKINNEHFNGTDINKRAHFFSERAYEVFNKFYDLSKKSKRPDHIIHVSCTGYISPSAPQRIVSEGNWGQSSDVTHAYHMGCYASLPAVRLAKSIVCSEHSDNIHFTADIVHNEMCGLHMNAAAQTPEQMVVQTLFADGHIKYTATTSKVANEGKNLKVIAILEKIIPNSQQDMSWIPAPWGMQMNLSRDVPDKIKPELKKFAAELFLKANLNVDEAMKSIFAIHPGGPKIIDFVKEVLELNEDQISESRKILLERGNMSSATLPHVWNEILGKNYPIGTKVISFAFGPGLTVFGSVYEVC